MKWRLKMGDGHFIASFSYWTEDAWKRLFGHNSLTIMYLMAISPSREHGFRACHSIDAIYEVVEVVQITEDHIHRSRRVVLLATLYVVHDFNF